MKGKRKKIVKAGLLDVLKEPRWMYIILLWFFCLLAILLYLVDFAGQSWHILAASALGFFALEFYLNWRGFLDDRMRKALFMGVFLLIFDFVFQTSGALLGLWGPSGSIYILGAVPVEVMAITLFGGIAWALYLPKKFDLSFSLLDILLFSFFGAFGEWLLIRNGVFYYAEAWTSIHAFISYAFTWAVLHYVNYNVRLESEKIV